MRYWWEGKPWRMIQTNMREIDMLDIDAERVVADLQEFKATAILFNAAGIIASYPTTLPFQFQSPFLKGDSMTDVISACHGAGIRVLARTDFSKIRRPIYEMHPDWAFRTAEDDIVDYNGDVHACVLGDYQQVYALKIIEELLTTHDLDGIFFNMGGFQTRDYSGNRYGLCHCQRCQGAFHAMFGLEIPASDDMADPAFRKHLIFQRRALAAHREKVSGLIRSIRPDICIDKDSSFGHGLIRQESNTAMDRPLPHWQYSASANTKWAVGTYPDMVSSNSSVDFVDFPYRHVAVSPHQQELRLAQNLANGGALDYYLIGRLDNHQDRSGFEPVKRMFHYHASHQDDYLGLASCANVMLLNDSRCGDPECRGWFRFLAEGHYLFDAPLVDTALERSWDQYRAIVLPDVKYMSDDLARRIDRFVADGGTLVASGQTSLYDECYERRGTPALESLGIIEVEWVKEDMRSSYLLLDDRTGLDRFGDRELIYLDGPYVYCRYGDSAQECLRLVPPHNYGPPERCYYETVIDRPGYVVNRYGEGMAIFLPWMPGQLFHRQGHTNTSDLAWDLLEHVAGIPRVMGNLSSMVEVTLFKNEERGYSLLHLVNGSGHYGTSFYEPVTMRDVVVSVRMEDTPTSARSLVSSEEIPFSHSDGVLELRAPTLDCSRPSSWSWAEAPTRPVGQREWRHSVTRVAGGQCPR